MNRHNHYKHKHFTISGSMSALLRLSGLVLGGSLLLTACTTSPVSHEAPAALEDSIQIPAPARQEVRQDRNRARAPFPTPRDDIEWSNFPADVLNRVIIAEMAGQRGLNETALSTYHELAVETRDINIVRRASRIALFVRDIEAAAEITALWLELEPDSIEAMQTQALQMLELRRYHEALHYFSELYARGYEMDFRLISNRMQNSNRPAANLPGLIASFESLRQQYPDDMSLRLALVDIYQQNAQYREAHALISPLTRNIAASDVNLLILDIALLQALGNHQEAELKLERSLNSHPESRQLRFQYARGLLEEERYEDAITQFDIIVAQDPDDANMLLSLALINLEVNRLETAAAQFRQLLGHRRHDNDARYYLGNIHEQLGQRELAIEYYQQVQDGNNYVAAQNSITSLLIADGRYAEASSRLRDIRAEKPEYQAELLAIEASLLIEREDRSTALGFLNTSLEQHPNNLQLLYIRALLKHELGDLDGMEDDLRHIIHLNPGSPVAYNTLGYILADQTDRYEEAYQLIRRAIQLAPDDPAIIDSLGWVQYRLGRYEEARQNLRLAFELYPDHEVAAHLGEVLWVLGEHDEARQIWQQALENEPDSEYIRDAMERLIRDPAD